MENTLMTRAYLEALSQKYLNGLLDDTLSFWVNNATDHEFGGYMTCLDREGKVFDTDKGIWHQGRYAWMLGHLYNHCKPDPQWLDICRQTLEFLKKFGFDSDGRMFFQTTREGLPVRKRRYAFSESFAAIAFGEYAKAAKDDSAAAMAEKCFNIFANHIPYPPKYTAVRPMMGMAPLMIKIITAQQLRNSIHYDRANADIDRAIEQIHTYFMKSDIRCVMENVAPDGSIVDSCDGRMLNPGHAIEGAWFIMNEGRIRQNSDYIKIGCDILDWMWERGWDELHGGLFYFRDVYHKPVVEYWHDMKFWWNHNEAIIATLMAYSLIGNERYARMHKQVHDWAYMHFADTEYGEWYGYLHRDGTPSTTQKGNIFKGCFHLPRMQWECHKLCENLLHSPLIK